MQIYPSRFVKVRELKDDGDATAQHLGGGKVKGIKFPIGILIGMAIQIRRRLNKINREFIK